MKKQRKWRVLAMIGGAVALVVAGVGFSVFLQSKEDQGPAENPDYVRAAKLLPAARQEAEAMFGPLTWEEYREENGIAFQDDSAAWEEVLSNMPTVVREQYQAYPPRPRSQREVFLAERDWFFRVRSQVDGLRIMHVPDADGEYWDYVVSSSCGDMIKALYVGIEGAADAGDAEAVLEIGRTSNTIIAAFEVEPSLMHRLRATALQAITDSAILRAAVRTRSNPAILKSLRTVLDERPPIPTIREVMNADARHKSLYLQTLSKMTTAEIEEMLDRWAELGLRRRLPRIRPRRKMGEHTAAALEARAWELMVKYTTLFENVVAQAPNARQEIDAFDSFLMDTKDASYEYAHWPILSSTVNTHIRSGFNKSALRTAVALIERYPVYTDLPEALPADLSFLDPFSGEPVIYSKTPRGFLIASKYSQPFPPGAMLDKPDHPESYASISFSEDGTVWGLRVRYNPIVPTP